MNRHGMLLLALLCASRAPAHAQEAGAPGSDAIETKRAQIETQQAASARERSSQPGADPWSVDSSTVLFTRPDFHEALELTADSPGVFAISFAPSVLFIDEWLLKGIEITGGWNHDTQTASAGAVWNVSLRDARWLSRERVKEIGQVSGKARTDCIAALPEEMSAVQLAQARVKCEARVRETLERELQRYWWPAFGLGVSAGYDWANRRPGHVKASLAVDFQGQYGIAVTANADFIDEPVESMPDVRTRRTGGGLALNFRPQWKQLEKFALTAGAKYLYCLRECMNQKSPWELGGSIGYEIKDGTLVGLSLLWKDADLRDPAVGLSLSTSFGELPWTKQ
jgi:hypothetical protein